jgi:hypothetical protein
VRGVPTVFWVFDESILPAGYNIVADAPPDERCHCNIFSVSEAALMEICEAIDPKQLSVCRNGDHSTATDADITEFKRQAQTEKSA